MHPIQTCSRLYLSLFVLLVSIIARRVVPDKREREEERSKIVCRIEGRQRGHVVALAVGRHHSRARTKETIEWHTISLARGGEVSALGDCLTLPICIICRLIVVVVDQKHSSHHSTTIIHKQQREHNNANWQRSQQAHMSTLPIKKKLCVLFGDYIWPWDICRARNSNRPIGMGQEVDGKQHFIKFIINYISSQSAIVSFCLL